MEEAEEQWFGAHSVGWYVIEFTEDAVQLLQFIVARNVLARFFKKRDGKTEKKDSIEISMYVTNFN